MIGVAIRLIALTPISRHVGSFSAPLGDRRARPLRGFLEMPTVDSWLDEPKDSSRRRIGRISSVNFAIADLAENVCERSNTVVLHTRKFDSEIYY